MKKQHIGRILAMCMMLSLFVGCAQTPTETTEATVATTIVPEETEPQVMVDKLADKLTTLGGEVEPTGVTKEDYARIVALCLAEYHKINDLETATVKSLESSLQSYSRIVCSMAVLIDYAKDHAITPFAEEFSCELFRDVDTFRAMFDRMMLAGCEAAVGYAGKDVENFSVKELVLAYQLAKDAYPEASVAAWGAPLRNLTPDSTVYPHANKMTNRNAYIIGGEQLRSYLGLADSQAVEQLVDASLKRQQVVFDENGMYRDNYDTVGELDPSLYDLTTRVQLQLVAGFGYEGKYADTLNSILRKGGLMTLYTTSANGEIAYGGRSNQYLFNAALISANCEYEANHYAAAGDTQTAGAFKRTAHLAMQSISKYLAANKHIMNFYAGSKIGTEDYGNYDKYMATMSSFLAIAYLFADDTIAETATPLETGGYVVETSEYFQSVIASTGTYSIQILTRADSHYDSTGLGRIHKAGVYSALGLSTPITATPTYTVPSGMEAEALSLCPVWFDGQDWYSLAELNSLKHSLTVLQETPDCVEFVLTYTGRSIYGCSAVEEHYTLTDEGLKVTVTLPDYTGGKLRYCVPLLASNGDGPFAGQPEITAQGSGFQVTMDGQTYTVTSDADIVTVGEAHHANRNGEYRKGILEKEGNTITVEFRLEG